MKHTEDLHIQHKVNEELTKDTLKTGTGSFRTERRIVSAITKGATSHSRSLPRMSFGRKQVRSNEQEQSGEPSLSRSKQYRKPRPMEEQQKLVEETREHQVDVEPRFTSKRKNCRIEERDSDSEGVFGRAASSSKHYADVRVRAREVEEMHGKDDIRNSEELKNQKQKQSAYPKSMDPTLNAKMMDENNETFPNTTLSSTNTGQLLQQVQICNCNMRRWPRR